MRHLKLAIEHSKGTWFGSLEDERRRLVASALGPNPESIRGHLIAYSRRKGGPTPDIIEDGFTGLMIDLFNGLQVSVSISFNADFITPFQRRVIRVLNQIPLGKVTTYGLIARRLDSGPRAVGGAVASNPWPLFVPCHRVVNADMTLGNYSICGNIGRGGTVTKKALLSRENVPIRNERVDPVALWEPSETAD